MRRRCRRLVAVAALAVVAILIPAPASAHEPGATLLVVTTTGADVQFAALVPLDRLENALGTELTDDPSVVVGKLRPTVVDLFETKVAVVASALTAWSLRVDNLDVTRVDKVDSLEARFTATPPAGHPIGDFELRYEVVTDIDHTHKVYVGARRVGGGTPKLLGTITHDRPTIAVRANDVSLDESFRAMIGVGFEHFREGVDHLLFLVLVALAALSRRAGFWPTVRSLAILTAAFTLGHSVSLTLATLGVVTLPSQVVETGIAVTILVTAIHITRPLVPDRLEAAITFIFGVVHGFGFAGTLGDLSVRGLAILPPTLGFNVGLELAQLAVLVLIALPVWSLARSRIARNALAAAVGTIALFWIAERAFGAPNPVEPFPRSPPVPRSSSLSPSSSPLRPPGWPAVAATVRRQPTPSAGYAIGHINRGGQWSFGEVNISKEAL